VNCDWTVGALMKASIDKVDPSTDYTEGTLGKTVDGLPGLIITCLPFNWLKGGWPMTAARTRWAALVQNAPAALAREKALWKRTIEAGTDFVAFDAVQSGVEAS
jgi:hypothetical protein